MKETPTTGLLPSKFPVSRPPRVSMNRRVGLLILILTSVLSIFYIQGSWLQRTDSNLEDFLSSTCPQTQALIPQKNEKLWETVGGTFGEESFKSQAVEWLAGAVRVPSVSVVSMTNSCR
jgi:hypothetical protein